MLTTIINTISNFAGDLLMLPFRGLGPWAGMIGVSLVLSVLIVLLFKYCSNQRALKAGKDRAIARFLELLLYRDDFVVSLTAFGRVMRANLAYLKECLKPLVVLAAPLVLILIQLAAWFDSRPLKPGEQALVKVGLTHLQRSGLQARLEGDEGIEVETEPLLVPGYSMGERPEVDWRIRVKEEGQWTVRAHLLSQTAEKSVGSGNGLMKLSRRRPAGHGLDTFKHPGEAPLPSESLIEWIEVTYPRGELRLAGMNVHWLLAFFVLTLCFGLILKRPLRAEL